MSSLTDAIKRDIHILDYGASLGFTPQQVSGDQWNFKEHDSCRVSFRDNVFFRHSSNGDAKGSIIDFVMHFENLSQDDAIKHLRGMLPQFKGAEHMAGAKEQRQQPRERKDFEQSPKKQGQYKNAFAYLTQTRGLDKDLVQQLMKEGLVYQDERNNVCFLGKDYDGEIKYGFARGTITSGDGEPFRGNFTGSNSDVGFSVSLVDRDTPPSRLFVSESCIDSLSLATLCKIHDIDLTDSAFLSLGGCSTNALDYHIGHNPDIGRVYLCQDNDDAGNLSRAACEQLLAEKGYEGKVIVKPPRHKDFNDDLLVLRQAMNIENEKGIHHEQSFEYAP